jgi:hypothetical protein
MTPGHMRQHRALAEPVTVTYRRANNMLVAPALEVEEDLGDVAPPRRVLQEGDWSIIGTPDLSTPCKGVAAHHSIDYTLAINNCVLDY